MSRFTAISAPFKPIKMSSVYKVHGQSVIFQCKERDFKIIRKIMLEKNMNKNEVLRLALKHLNSQIEHQKQERKLIMELLDKYPL
jgi:hypothetical protein